MFMVLMLLAVTVTNGMLLDFLLILLPVMLMPVSVTKKMLLLLFLLLLLFPALGTFPAHAENRFIVEDFRKLDKEEQLTRLIDLPCHEKLHQCNSAVKCRERPHIKVVGVFQRC